MRDLDEIAEPFQQLADDLALVLHAGHAPRLRYLWLGNLGCTHCFGQRYADGVGAVLDDRKLLEELRPTAALWWMAERAQHVRCSKLHQFQYEVEHGADLRAAVGSFTILTWMHERLGLQRHSRPGHRAVHDLLCARGAVADRPFRPLDQWLLRQTARARRQNLAEELGYELGDASDLDDFTEDEDEAEDGVVLDEGGERVEESDAAPVDHPEGHEEEEDDDEEDPMRDMLAVAHAAWQSPPRSDD